MPNVMSLPNRGDTNRGDNKKKSIGAVDASMITRMKRDQAIVSGVRTEPNARTNVNFTTGVPTTTGTANQLSYSFPLQTSVPFVNGEFVTISANGSVHTTAADPATTTQNIAATVTAITATGLTTLTLPTTGTLRNNQIIKFITSAPTGLNTTDSYVISQLTITGATTGTVVLLSSTGAALSGITPIASGGTGIIRVSGGGSIVVITYGTGSSITDPIFAAGDTFRISGHSYTATGVAEYGGTNEAKLDDSTYTVISSNSTTLTAQSATTFDYAGSATAAAHNSTGGGTVIIRPTNLRYNGTFLIVSCSTSSVVLSTPYYGLLKTLTGGIVSGNLPPGTSFTQIRDGMMTRGFTDGPVMPFNARGVGLSF